MQATSPRLGPNGVAQVIHSEADELGHDVIDLVEQVGRQEDIWRQQEHGGYWTEDMATSKGKNALSVGYWTEDMATSKGKNASVGYCTEDMGISEVKNALSVIEQRDEWISSERNMFVRYWDGNIGRVVVLVIETDTPCDSASEQDKYAGVAVETGWDRDKKTSKKSREEHILVS